MKTKYPKYLMTMAAMIAFAGLNSMAADPVLSPRAQANQIRKVQETTNAEFVLVPLGAAPRFKAMGGFSVEISSGTKDSDLVTGSNNLGIAARTKASGGSAVRTSIQVAPLK